MSICVQRCNPSLLQVETMRFTDFQLIPGLHPNIILPSLVFTLRLRNLYPRKSNYLTFAGARFLLPFRLQYTNWVLSGCSSNLLSLSRSRICLRTNLAYFSFFTYTITSFAYRSNGQSGNYSSIQLSNTTCKNVFARSGLITPP
jgi:hypothetical protein